MKDPITLTSAQEDEIQVVIDDAHDSIDEGRSRWPSMTYEQGVADALRWISGDRDEAPFEEN